MYGHALDAVDPTKIWGIHVFDNVSVLRQHMASDHYPSIAETILNPLRRWTFVDTWAKS